VLPELLHRGLQCLDVGQVQFDQKTMLRENATVQGLDELRKWLSAVRS
jgi:hypothetical protein